MKTQQLTDHVAFVEGNASNWIIIGSEDTFSLIDTGYPGDLDELLRSITDSGYNLKQCSSILITHGHNDHVGNAAWLERNCAALVFCAAAEKGNLTGEHREEVVLKEIIPLFRKLRVIRWLYHAVKVGGLKFTPVLEPHTLNSAVHVGDVVVSPFPVEGHTSGSLCFSITDGDTKLIATGDALITGHPIASVQGRIQNLDPVFHHDAEQAQSRYKELLELAGSYDYILPGHGPFLSKEQYS